MLTPDGPRPPLPTNRQHVVLLDSLHRALCTHPNRAKQPEGHGRAALCWIALDVVIHHPDKETHP